MLSIKTHVTMYEANGVCGGGRIPKCITKKFSYGITSIKVLNNITFTYEVSNSN